MPVVRNLSANAADARDLISIPGLGRSSEEGNGMPLQYFCLGNPMDRVAWWATVYGVSKNQTQLRTGHTCTAQLRMNKQKITV